MTGAPVLPEAGFSGLGDRNGITNVLEAPFDPVPQGVIDNAKIRNVFNNPLIFGIRPGQAFAGVRIFDVALLIPD